MTITGLKTYKYLTDTYFSSVDSKSVFTPGNASDEVEVHFAPLEIC